MDLLYVLNAIKYVSILVLLKDFPLLFIWNLMSAEDPFYIVKREVEKAVDNGRQLYSRWSALASQQGVFSREEFDWIENELRNNLRSIEWDLEDLEETVSIVEKNPTKFRIKSDELRDRRSFISETRQILKLMKENMAQGKNIAPVDPRNSRSASAQILPESKVLIPSSTRSKGTATSVLMPPTGYSRLDDEEATVNSGGDYFVESELQKQKLIIQRQDEQIDAVGGTVGLLKDMSHAIGNELDDQSRMLDEFNEEVDTTKHRMDSVMKKMSTLLHLSSDRRQWCAIGILLALLLLVIILFIVL